MNRFLKAAAVLTVAAFASGCAAGPSSGSWSASSWNGLAPQNVYGGNYQFYAAPAEGQGFKLKFTVKTDGNFNIASAGPPAEADLEAAAKAAAPEGCTLASIERTADGGAVADYDCGEAAQ
ncbi:hypothetical protein [Hyphomonas sp. GM-8P]|uniref:hypothetical protein n=1 Tax=Hyphomonas sp. GM-8P TaxID=1280945 RepID=UPI000DBFEC2A|nr:hypothetical protein [Hyphomonas sp. GM-8P]RAN41181.1 hypothetical protein HY26_09915 [Hyphomonas sp. GM-8P]